MVSYPAALPRNRESLERLRVQGFALGYDTIHFFGLGMGSSPSGVFNLFRNEFDKVRLRSHVVISISAFGLDYKKNMNSILSLGNSRVIIISEG